LLKKLFKCYDPGRQAKSLIFGGGSSPPVTTSNLFLEISLFRVSVPALQQVSLAKAFKACLVFIDSSLLPAPRQDEKNN